MTVGFIVEKKNYNPYKNSDVTINSNSQLLLNVLLSKLTVRLTVKALIIETNFIAVIIIVSCCLCFICFQSHY